MRFETILFFSVWFNLSLIGVLFFFTFRSLAAVDDLPLGLLPVQEFPRKHHRDRQFLPLGSKVKLWEIVLFLLQNLGIGDQVWSKVIT